MKKLIFILITLVILAGMGLAIVFFQMNDIIKAAIEKYGSEITGVKVTLGMAEVSPMSGEGALSSFSIGNPEGFKAPTAFNASRISIKVDKESLKTDTIVITELTIDAPHIDYELAGTSNNFAIIQAHIRRKLAETNASMKGAEDTLDSKVIVISDLYVKNGSITVTAPIIAGQAYKVSLPDIHMQNLGKGDKPGNLPKIMQQVMMVLTGDIMSAVGPVTIKNFDRMITNGGIVNPLNDVQKTIQGIGKEVGM